MEFIREKDIRGQTKHSHYLRAFLTLGVVRSEIWKPRGPQCVSATRPTAALSPLPRAIPLSVWLRRRTNRARRRRVLLGGNVVCQPLLGGVKRRRRQRPGDLWSGLHHRVRAQMGCAVGKHAVVNQIIAQCQRRALIRGRVARGEAEAGKLV